MPDSSEYLKNDKLCVKLSGEALRAESNISEFMIRLTFLFCVLFFSVDAWAQEVQRLDAAPKPTSLWKPVENAMQTTYAGDITPKNVHQEYPRPTMIREKWLNLNGVWEMKPELDQQHPTPKDYAPQPNRKTYELQLAVPEEDEFEEEKNETETPSPESDAPTPEIHDMQPHTLAPPDLTQRNSGTIYRGQSVRLSRKDATEAYPYRVLVPFPLESSLSGIRYPFDSVAYRRHFKVPNDWSDDDRIRLHFGAVDWEAAVIVNGRLIGVHRGGYDSFSFDLSEVLRKDGKYERDVSHELIVSVYDPTQKGGPFGKQATNPQGTQCGSVTGIWQTVWLEPVPATCITEYAAAPNIDESNVAIRVSVDSAKTDPVDPPLIVAEVFRKQESITKVYGGTDGTILLLIPDEELVFWTPENPFLYTLKIELLQSGRTVDSFEGYFGMRKIDLAKDSRGVVRIRLNNMFRFQMGVLDPGLWPDGLYTAPSDEAIRRELRTIKELGFTMIRKHAKIEPERWYHWCDRLGILVWQDMPAAENHRASDQQQFATELTRMLRTRQNHPSIVTWVLFHEGKGQHDTERYAELLHRLDPGRLVDAASGWRDQNVGQVVDLHQFPGPAAPKPEPFRASVLGEFGGIACPIPGHTWTKKTWGYQMANDPDDFARRYRRTMVALEQLVKNDALSAAVYHQLTDVESECGGLITYDRKVIKIPLETIRSLNGKTTETRKH